MVNLSVIVLIYNMEELLPRCLESLEKQTMKGMQYVLVDDGSTDGSGKICDEWKPEGHTVKVIHKQNEGVTAGWMDGVTAADGLYVGFVDSDDYIDEDMFEVLWQNVENNNVEISMCNHLYERNGVKTPNGKIIEEGVYVGEELGELRYKVLPKIAERYLSPSLCNKIFRKELFVDNWQFCDKRVTVADDVSVVLPCMFGAKSMSYVDRPLYHYVTRNDSVTYSYKENMYLQHELLLDGIERAISFYQTDLPTGAYEEVVCAMGNQWLRMIARAPIKRKQKKQLLKMFYVDERYVSAAKTVKTKNKWAKAYCEVAVKHRYFKFRTMLWLLDVRNKIKR